MKRKWSGNHELNPETTMKNPTSQADYTSQNNLKYKNIIIKINNFFVNKFIFNHLIDRVLIYLWFSIWCWLDGALCICELVWMSYESWVMDYGPNELNIITDILYIPYIWYNLSCFECQFELNCPIDRYSPYHKGYSSKKKIIDLTFQIIKNRPTLTISQMKFSIVGKYSRYISS